MVPLLTGYGACRGCLEGTTSKNPSVCLRGTCHVVYFSACVSHFVVHRPCILMFRILIILHTNSAQIDLLDSSGESGPHEANLQRHRFKAKNFLQY